MTAFKPPCRDMNKITMVVFHNEYLRTMLKVNFKTALIGMVFLGAFSMVTTSCSSDDDETEINPDRATEILARGYRYGENRLVVGAHWQSDTDAARLAASAAYARLHTSERFLEQMKKAREEYQRLKGETTPVQSARIVPMTDGTAYTLQGTPATSSTRGIIIEGSQKVVRK